MEKYELFCKAIALTWLSKQSLWYVVRTSVLESHGTIGGGSPSNIWCPKRALRAQMRANKVRNVQAPLSCPCRLQVLPDQYILLCWSVLLCAWRNCPSTPSFSYCPTHSYSFLLMPTLKSSVQDLRSEAPDHEADTWLSVEAVAHSTVPKAWPAQEDFSAIVFQTFNRRTWWSRSSSTA